MLCISRVPSEVSIPHPRCFSSSLYSNYHYHPTINFTLHLWFFSQSTLIKQNTLKFSSRTTKQSSKNHLVCHKRSLKRLMVSQREESWTCPEDLPLATTGHKKHQQNLPTHHHTQHLYVSYTGNQSYFQITLSFAVSTWGEKKTTTRQSTATSQLLCCLPPPAPTPPAAPKWAAPGSRQDLGGWSPAPTTRVKEKASHLFCVGSCRSSSHHPRLPAARKWRRAHHRCEIISLSALTRRRNLSSLQHARGSLCFVWVWKISKRTPFSFSFKPATGLGSKTTFL